MNIFYKILSNALVANTTNSFLWFAITFWAYLETQSVIATSIIGGSYMLFAAVLGLFFGTYVDHHKKKQAMLVSSGITLIAFTLATILYAVVPHDDLINLSGVQFWTFALLILAGAIAGNMRMIALSTTVSLLVDKDKLDKANGMVGATNGLAFAITSVFSGLVIGMLGMDWALWISVTLTAVVVVHLLTINFPEKSPHPTEEKPKKMDIKGTIAAITAVPGLIALIFFTTFNNFLGGVYMSLLDAYGLSLVSVEFWGILWAVLSTAFIAGGLIVAKKGLGKSPLRLMFLANIAMWTISIFFTIQASIILLAIGMFVYMLLIPVIEAAEQTIIQKVVTHDRQGRVFGFAQSVEAAASPITAFMIGPIAQLMFIPFMSEGGQGAQLIGSWFGVGPARGIALIFIIAGVVGLGVTVLAMASRSYKVLLEHSSHN
jgi:MFS transporter, DHA3 family, multidrug efflux protein